MTFIVYFIAVIMISDVNLCMLFPMTFVVYIIRVKKISAVKLCMLFRYIDDVLIWDVLPPSPDVYNLQYSE